jgi:hypothetical protein
MKNKFISFGAVAVFSVLAMVFSFTSTVSAQVAVCPAGYVCTPVQTTPGCPAGYVCTPADTGSSSGGSGGSTTPVPTTPTPIPYPVPTSCYTFSKNLTIGATGADVVALQTWLINNGYNIPAISEGRTAKGYFGVTTARALARYQAAVGIEATGLVLA